MISRKVKSFVSLESYEDGLLKLNLLVIDGKQMSFSMIERSGDLEEFVSDASLDQNDWVKVTIEKNEEGAFSVYAFDLSNVESIIDTAETNLNLPLLFSERVNLKIHRVQISQEEIREINELIDIDEIHNNDSDGERVQEIVEAVGKDIEFAAVLNVGQGNLNEVFGEHQIPLFYFDLGGTAHYAGNAYRILKRKLCFSQCQPIVLSHWDIDHYAQLVFYFKFCGQVLAPPPRLRSQFERFIIGQLLRLDKLNIVPDGYGVSEHDYFSLVKVDTNNFNDSNNNSIVLLVKLTKSKRKLLLPGDVNYQNLPQRLKKNRFYSVVASHHGGYLNRNGILPRTQYPLPYKSAQRLVFSHGRRIWNNRDHHPFYSEVEKYKERGWKVRNTYSTFFGDIFIGRTKNIVQPCIGRYCDTGFLEW